MCPGWTQKTDIDNLTSGMYTQSVSRGNNSSLFRLKSNPQECQLLGVLFVPLPTVDPFADVVGDDARQDRCE
jgi:hypothetical protein